MVHNNEVLNGPGLRMMINAVARRIQPSEYYRRFLEYKIRPDGRHPAALRDIKICKSVLKNDSFLSSSVVSSGHSRFLAAVTAEIAPPHPSASKSGKVVINVEFPRSCGADHLEEVCGDTSQMAAQTSVALCHIFSNPEVIDTTQFCIKENLAVWILYVNVVCLGYDGNAIDWSLCAVTAALEDVVLPTIEWDNEVKWWRLSTSGDSSSMIDVEDPPMKNREKLIHSRVKKNGDDDKSAAAADLLIWKCQNVLLKARPSSLTLLKLLNEYWLIDPTSEEENLGDSLTVWRAGAHGHLNLLRSGGTPIDIHQLFQSLFEISQTGMDSIQMAFQNAIHTDQHANWEIAFSDEEDNDEI